MSWRWEFTERSEEQLKNLDRPVRQRIIEKLSYWTRSDFPLEFAEPLTQFKLGMYRFRVGAYRITFDVEGETIVVLAVGHRRDIYK